MGQPAVRRASAGLPRPRLSRRDGDRCGQQPDHGVVDRCQRSRLRRHQRQSRVPVRVRPQHQQSPPARPHRRRPGGLSCAGAGSRRHAVHRWRPEHARPGAADSAVSGRFSRSKSNSGKTSPRRTRITPEATCTATIPPSTTPARGCRTSRVRSKISACLCAAIHLRAGARRASPPAVRPDVSGCQVLRVGPGEEAMPRRWTRAPAQVYSGPERTWRSVPRAMYVAPDGRVYTSGEDGRVVYYDPESQKLQLTTMQIPGEYWEASNYYGYPVIEQWVADARAASSGPRATGSSSRCRPTAGKSSISASRASRAACGP